MKVTFLVLLVAVISAFASAVPSASKYVSLSTTQRQSLQERIKAHGGCNANVCFAIDGSGSVGRSGFDAQKQFVFDVASIINVDKPAGLAAIQYGAHNQPICPLTFDSADFNEKLHRSRYLRARYTQIRGGLLYCFNQLRKETEDANKIVLLGDGEANLGGNPVPMADLFRRMTGGSIAAVGVRYADTQSLLDIVGGDPSLVLTVDDFFQLKDIIDALVVKICGL